MGTDGMTVEAALPYLREHNHELVNRIRKGHYTPQSVRRVEIPKPDGGIRKLGIPTVIDRIIQQAMAQQMIPIYEPLFAEGSCGCRPGRSAKDAILKVKEYQKRGVPCIRYADGIVLLAKSERAAKRLLETSTKYLEGTLKLKVNQEKSRVVSVFAIRNFKYLGFALGRNRSGIYVRVHPKSWLKFRNRMRELSSRRHCQSIRPSLKKIEVYAGGWLNYYGIASMKNSSDDINGWLYHRIRMCIWKQWKKPKTKFRNLVKLGIPEYFAHMVANSRKGYWRTTQVSTVNRALSKERLIRSGFYDLAIAYQSMHVNY